MVKNIKCFTFIGIFIAGFLTYGILDRVISAQQEAMFRSDVNSCQLELVHFAQYNKFSSVIVSNNYTVISAVSNNIDNYICVFCSLSHHQNRGANVLYADGTVQWLTVKEFKERQIGGRY